MVVKKDNRREPYERTKVIAGVVKACEKRPVSMELIEQLADRIEAAVADGGGKEVPSSFIGTAVMNELRLLDQVAYVRFASVYRSFKDIEEFMDELQELLQRRKQEADLSPMPAKKGEPMAAPAFEEEVSSAAAVNLAPPSLANRRDRRG
jgi:transcriptional regulator NrdR family protein